MRSTGAVNPLTRQPIKGRKKGGGIRLGEMERDALLAHGAAYLLRDRLMTCSDRSIAWVCTSCGEMLAPTAHDNKIITAGFDSFDRQLASSRKQGSHVRWHCRHPSCVEASARRARAASTADICQPCGTGSTTGGGEDVAMVNAGEGKEGVLEWSSRSTGVPPDTPQSAAAAAARTAAAAEAKARSSPAAALADGRAAKGTVVPVEVPYVYRFLLSELVGMNIKVKLDVADVNNV